MEESGPQISEATARRVTTVTTVVVVGAVVGAAVWFDRVTKRWWEEHRSGTPGGSLARRVRMAEERDVAALRALKGIWDLTRW